MAKRKHSSSKNKSKTLIYIAWSLALLVLLLSSLIAGYYFGYSNAKEEIRKNESLLNKKRATILERLDETNKSSEGQSVNNRLKEVLNKEVESKEVLSQEVLNKEIVSKEVLGQETTKKEVPKKEVLKNISEDQVSAAHEYDDPALDVPPKREIKQVLNKPKLAIIIDDMSLKSQVVAVENLHIPLTMSFMPPRTGRAESARLADAENFYMVHLPLEALNFTKEEPDTLHVGDSQQKISERIKEIKRIFPKVKYLNNHTGSKFTSNEVAMNRLIFALKNNNIQFVDSRTTGQTEVPKVMENFGLRYISRDVFLDHQTDKSYILKQIKEAIRIAKLHGTAIAIGHPQANTILALSESKELLKQVDLVYINKLY